MTSRAVVIAGAIVIGMSGCSGDDAHRGPAGNAVDTTDGMNGMRGMEGMAMDGNIRLSSDEIATFGITFGEAAVQSLSRTVRTVGLVEFDETAMTRVAPRFGGWVERLHANFTGQPVRAGQPLLEIYSPELITAQEELLLAARMLESVGDSRVGNVAEGARNLYDASRRRLVYWDISAEQIDKLVESGEVRRTLTFHAPVSGIVMEKSVVEGQAFQAGQSLFMIADFSEVWVNAEVFDADAVLVRAGMPAEVTFAALPGKAFSGRIEYVYPTLEDRTRSMRARIALRNPGGQLKPGMYATVRVTAVLGETLTVPASAVLYSGERAVAFVDMDGGEIMPHELVIGARGDGLVQVLSGLAPGQRVVTSAQFLLDSESNLAEVMKAMIAQMSTSDMGGTDVGDMDMGRGTGPDTTGGR